MDARDRRNIAAVRRFYQAEREVAAPNLVWHVPGHNAVSGDYRGPQEYFELLPSRMAPLDAWDIGVETVMVNGDVVVASFSLTGERRGRRIALRGCHVFQLNEHGEVSEGWGFVDDQDVLDAFFAA